jgi:hypothetical protein
VNFGRNAATRLLPATQKRGDNQLELLGKCPSANLFIRRECWQILLDLKNEGQTAMGDSAYIETGAGVWLLPHLRETHSFSQRRQVAEGPLPVRQVPKHPALQSVDYRAGKFLSSLARDVHSRIVARRGLVRQIGT